VQKDDEVEENIIEMKMWRRRTREKKELTCYKK